MTVGLLSCSFTSPIALYQRSSPNFTYTRPQPEYHSKASFCFVSKFHLFPNPLQLLFHKFLFKSLHLSLKSHSRDIKGSDPNGAVFIHESYNYTTTHSREFSNGEENNKYVVLIQGKNKAAGKYDRVILCLQTMIFETY